MKIRNVPRIIAYGIPALIEAYVVTAVSMAHDLTGNWREEDQEEMGRTFRENNRALISLLES